MKFLIHWIVTVIGLFVAYLILSPSGLITINGTNAWVAFAVMGAVLGLVNIFIRPVLKFLSCAFIVLTVGLFMLVINAFLLWVSSQIAVNWLHVDFVVKGAAGAFLGSIIVSIVSFIIHLFIHDRRLRV